MEKLGIREGTRVAILREPAGYLDLLQGLAERVELKQRLVGRFDFIQYFASSGEQLEAVMPNLARSLRPDGMLWVSWAKQGSPLHSGLNENRVRELGLQAGLVDVKVAALSEDWSGLKFVYRLTDR
jgi:hypothetical protein